MKNTAPLLALGAILASPLFIDFSSTEVSDNQTPTTVQVEMTELPTNKALKNSFDYSLVPPIAEAVEIEIPEPYEPYAEFEVVEYQIPLVEKETVCTIWKNWCGSTCNGNCGQHERLIEIETLYPALIDPTAKIAEAEGRVMDVEEPLLVDYEVSAYPNPFLDQATVEITNYDGDPYTFALYDLSGKMVEWHENQTKQQITVQRGDMAPGIYIYRIVNQSQTNIKSGKIIAQ
jgi:hypothetical protein